MSFTSEPVWNQYRQHYLHITCVSLSPATCVSAAHIKPKEPCYQLSQSQLITEKYMSKSSNFFECTKFTSLDDFSQLWYLSSSNHFSMNLHLPIVEPARSIVFLFFLLLLFSFLQLSNQTWINTFSLLSSFEAGSRGISLRWRGWGHRHSPEREILHPPSWGHRDLHVHVEVNPRPQIQGVGLGSCSGKTFIKMKIYFFCHCVQ